jgi:hypothetical protein
MRSGCWMRERAVCAAVVPVMLWRVLAPLLASAEQFTGKVVGLSEATRSACYAREERSKCGCMVWMCPKRRRPLARKRGSLRVTWPSSRLSPWLSVLRTATAAW